MKSSDNQQMDPIDDVASISTSPTQADIQEHLTNAALINSQLRSLPWMSGVIELEIHLLPYLLDLLVVTSYPTKVCIR